MTLKEWIFSFFVCTNHANNINLKDKVTLKIDYCMSLVSARLEWSLANILRGMLRIAKTDFKRVIIWFNRRRGCFYAEFSPAEIRWWLSRKKVVGSEMIKTYM